MIHSIIQLVIAISGLLTAITALVHSVRTRAYCDARYRRVRTLPVVPVDQKGAVPPHRDVGFLP